MEFVDSCEDFGDDEMSGDEDRRGDNPIQIENRNDEQNGNQRNSYDKKSTLATMEALSFTQKNTMQRRSSRENMIQSDFETINHNNLRP